MVSKYIDCTKLGKPQECRAENLDAFWKKAIDQEWIVLHRKNANASKGQQAWITFINKDPTPPQALKKGNIRVTGLDRSGEASFKIVREELARRKELVKELEIDSPSTVTIVTNGKELTRNTGPFLRQALQQGWVLLQGQKVWCPFLFGWEDLLQHLDEKISYMNFDEDKGLLTSLLRRRFLVATQPVLSSIVEPLPSSAAESSSTSAIVPSLETIDADESPPAIEITVDDVPMASETPSANSPPSPTLCADEAIETSTSSLQMLFMSTKDEDIASFHEGKAWTTHDYVKDLHTLVTNMKKSIEQRLGTLEQKLDDHGSKIDNLELTISKLSEYAVKSLFIHPMRSVKMKYTANTLLEDLARRCLKYEGKGESGKDIFKLRDVPFEVEIDIKMDIVEEENGKEKRDKCILVEVSRSPQLYTHNFHYPNKADYGPSSKLLYKLIQLERGILAVESSNMAVVAAALVNFPSFEYRSDGELKKLLRSVMESPAKDVVPKLLGLYNQANLYLLPF